MYKDYEMGTMLIGQGEEETAASGREIKQVVGYYENNEIFPALARPYLDRPEINARRLTGHEYAITCKTQAPPLMLEVWEFEDHTGIYRGSMKGTDSGDFDPPELWRDYRRLDPMTFQVKFLAPEDAKIPVFYFFNHDYLGAAAYCDQHV